MKKKLSKKTLLVLASSFMALGVSASLAACTNKEENASTSETSSVSSQEPVITKALEIVTQPTKTVFTIGEAFDASGIAVKLYTLTDGVKDEGISVSSNSLTFSIPEGTIFNKEDISSSKGVAVTYQDDEGTYTATLTIVVRDYDSFAVIFKNADGTVLETDTTRENKNPTYDGKTPTKEKEGDKYYLFKGWYVEGDETKTIVNLSTYVVTGDVTFVAYYQETGEDLNDGTFEYKIIDGEGYMVVGFQEGADETAVDIPASVAGIDVVAIAEEAFDGNKNIKSIKVGANVKKIEASAFYGVSAAETLELPEGLTEIGEKCFSNMTSLKKIEIPSTIKTIPYQAFYNCTGCSSLILHEGLESIKSQAFFGLSILSLTIPDTVTEIIGTVPNSFDEERNLYQDGPFQSCKLLTNIHIGASLADINYALFSELEALQTYTVSESNPNFTAVDGVLYSKDMKTLVAVPREWAYEKEDGSVDTEKTATFTIPSMVETVAYRAFKGSSNSSQYIKKIVFNDGLKKIQAEAFLYRKGCDFDFTSCTTLEKVEYEGFYGTTTESILLPASLTYVGYRAFGNNKTLKTVRLGKAMTFFGEDILNGSSNASVTFPEDADYFMDGEFLYNKDKTKAMFFTGKPSAPANKTLEIPSTVTEIADNFLNGVKITSLTLNEGLVKIGKNAFKSTSITSLAIPSTVREIGEAAFQSASSVTELSLNDELDSIGANAFNGLKKAVINKVTIKEGATVGAKAFYNLALLAELDYQASVLPEGAFYNCAALTKVTLSDAIEELPNDAFNGAKLIETINIPTSLKKVGTDVFSGNTKITAMALPETLEEVADKAFEKMTGLLEVTVPANVSKFGTQVFSGCTAMTKAVLNNSLTKLPNTTFSGCSKLADVTLPNTITEIGDTALKGTAITALELPATVTTLGTSAFEGCKSLKTFSGAGVKVIGKSAFASCTSLTSVTISDELAVLESGTFSGCSALANFTLPSSLTEIGYSALQGTAITSFTLPENVKFDASGSGMLFKGCTKLATVTLNSNVTNLGTELFSGDTALTSVTGLGSVTYLGTKVFNGCKKLTTIDLDASKVTNLGANSFQDCTALTEAFIPTNAKYTSMSNCTFQGATGLTSVTLPENVTSVGQQVFKNCTKLTTLTIESAALTTTSKMASYGFLVGSAVTTVNWESVTLSTAKELFTNAKTGLTKGKAITLNCSDGSESFTIA